MRTLASILAVLLATATASRANGGENFPFHVGEKLCYTIHWGPVVAGTASLEVAGMETVDGHECYRLVAKAQTTGLVDMLFHVDNTMESWFDAKEFYTRRYRQHRIEGKHTKRSETRYDYINKQFTITNHLSGTSCTLPLDGPLRDIVAALYYTRTQSLQVNQPIKFTVNAGDSNRLVNIKPDLQKKIWTNPLGEIPALRIEPNPTLTIVAANKGRMWIWVSDDAQKLPLVVISKLAIGSARFQLTNVESTNPALTKRLRPVSKD